MEKLHLPQNIKIHFAGSENISDARILNEMGINYTLYSAFPFIERKISKDKDSYEVPNFLAPNMKHVIQDSGLFSMLFGKYKGKVKPELVFRWYDALIEWTLGHNNPITCVEVDAQAIIGVEETWKLRERMRADLPNNRIINVWHLEDGLSGLDRMIEFSSYIAIGLPELRSAGKSDYALPIARYIKNKNPDIDIHLLGFTDFAHIKKFNFCTSCDSITWLSARRFGEIDNFYRTENLDTQKVKRMVGCERYESIKSGKEIPTNAMCVNLEWWKHKTQKICGQQDFKWMYN